MHSFQPSRGRILLEFFCALAIVASLVGAWQQTQASALLVAAGAAALLGMIRLFDMGRSAPAHAEEPQRIEFAPEARDELPAPPAREEPVVVALPLTSAVVSEEIALVEPEAPRSSAGRRKGGSRKGSGRRASAVKDAKPVELAAAVEIEVAEPAPAAEVEFVDLAPPVEPEVAELPPTEEPEFNVPEPAHVPHAPLFEPEPFVRMPRQAFGRRGRL